MPTRRLFMRHAHRPPLPRRTLRLRLTVLYGSLFLLSGAALLVIINVLVRNAAAGPVSVVVSHSSRGASIVVGGASARVQASGALAANPFAIPPGITAQQAHSLAEGLRPQLEAFRAHGLDQLLVFSAIALGVMAAVSTALGWVMAGRALRPLRAITAAARSISATNLNARLALAGPDDELKELGRTFNDLLVRLEGSFDAQRRFVANASHELRTPLARQRTLAQVALADPDATVESLRAAHERVLASGAQQERLIEAMLTLARGEAGIDRWEAVDLSVVVDGVLLGPLPEVQGQGLHVESDIKPATLVGDGRLVERLVANLVDNAVRHNVPGGRVDVATGDRDGRAVLTVTNTGPVVPPGEVERLFQPFQRMAPERTAHGPGVGLGLSIVRAVASSHGAQLRAVARPEGGLRVEVSFPAGPGGQPAAGA